VCLTLSAQKQTTTDKMKVANLVTFLVLIIPIMIISDMDIVIMLDKGKPGPGLLRTLAKKIRSSGFGINVEAIIFANVPIVKFQEPRTGIHVDISLNQLDGFKTGVTVQQFMAQMPALRPMTMLIKQFLKSKPAVSGLYEHAPFALILSAMVLWDVDF
jgi:hypothetical protein